MNKSMIQMSEIAETCWATFNDSVDNNGIKEGSHEELRNTLSTIKVEISRLKDIEAKDGSSWDLDKEMNASWQLVRAIENAFIKAMYK